ncbi:MAG: 50S ribosomal protein L21 [Fimbriimonadales bacterium]
MYAVVKAQGQQFKVQEQETLIVHRMPGEVGSEVQLSQVLLVGGEKSVVGTPYVAGASVQAKILRHKLGVKVNAFNYKAKKNVRKRWGHRQRLTELQITKINPGK